MTSSPSLCTGLPVIWGKVRQILLNFKVIICLPMSFEEDKNKRERGKDGPFRSTNFWESDPRMNEGAVRCETNTTKGN